MVANSPQAVFGEVCRLLKPVTENSVFEATELCSYFLSVEKTKLFTQTFLVEDKSYIQLMEAVQKRVGGYPLQYILGEWEFYGRRFAVGEGVLIPRADTETLIEAVLDWMRTSAKETSSLKIADLCSGSGCIAITLQQEFPESDVYAFEKSPVAFDYLTRNITAHHAAITPILADVLTFDDVPDGLDVIVSNPPYLTRSDMNALQTEVKHEPSMALFGEEDGLHFYREITKGWSHRLKAGGLLAYEIGQGQEQAVADILWNHGFTDICMKADLCDIIRVVYGTRQK